jgi:glycosyltransferase involved in cell wall biosynthesis
MLFYPVEKFCARYTDILITINREDYKIAKKFQTRKVEYIQGVGVDVKKILSLNINRNSKRNELGIPEDAFVMLSVGELNKNKNHQLVINSIAKLNNPNIYYIICGEGELVSYLKKLIIKLNLGKKVKLLGYRKDILEINKLADVFVFPSFREGLSLALMEAMACENPVICSNIRGNVDLIEEGKGGYLLKPNDMDGFASKIEYLERNREVCSEMGKVNLDNVRKYDKDNIKSRIEEIYSK